MFYVKFIEIVQSVAELCWRFCINQRYSTLLTYRTKASTFVNIFPPNFQNQCRRNVEQISDLRGACFILLSNTDCRKTMDRDKQFRLWA